MPLKKYVMAADKQQIYEHIYQIEGIRNPISDPVGLEKAKQYIIAELEDIGVDVTTHKFKLDGFDDTFENIEAKLSNYKDGEPELLITSHYDSEINSPGADDSASAVGVMLETARVLKKFVDAGDRSLNIRFVSFTLEERNPIWVRSQLQAGIDLGLTDDMGISKTLHFHELQNRLGERFLVHRSQGKSRKENYRLAFEDIKNDCSEAEVQYFERIVSKLEELYQPGKIFGKLICTGSNNYISWIEQKNLDIRGLINLESIGYTSTKPSSQYLPEGLEPDMFQKHNTDQDLNKGDFIAIIGDINSKELGDLFFQSAADEMIDLPSAYLHVPYDVKAIQQKMKDLLRSDHAPFWQLGIPALLVVDSVNFRNPYYHTMADTIDKLDFEFMQKICATTIMTAIRFFDDGDEN